MSHLTVVVSQGQSNDPQRRALEQTLAEQAAQMPGVETLVVPHLYDLKPGEASLTKLQQTSGDLIVAAWLFPRAAFWTLDRHAIGGQMGRVEMPGADDAVEPPTSDTPRVAEGRDRPQRTIWSLDLRTGDDAQVYLDEIRRIASQTPLPTRMEAAATGGNGQTPAPSAARPARRWYPVIDFSRCTNCMECIDFCLFGVYGIDAAETILVEQPDNCRKGCPACSRVCPEQAIIFPQHKTPAIAGSSQFDQRELKLDLSILFGGADAADTAAAERNEHLRLAGREEDEPAAPRRRRAAPDRGHDPLDQLIDRLDESDV